MHTSDVKLEGEDRRKNHLKPLLIFDLDGTLFRTETVDVFAFNEALASIGYPPKTQDEIMSFVGLPLDGICREMLKSDDSELLSKFKQDVINNESLAIPQMGKFYDGAIEMLKRLKNRGFLLCICSNGNKEYICDIANAFGLNDIFDEIWYEKSGITKSDAVNVLKQKYNAQQFIMIGDRLVDIQAAKDNAGVSIGVSYGYGKDEVLEADYVACSISELEELIFRLTMRDEKCSLL